MNTFRQRLERRLLLLAAMAHFLTGGLGASTDDLPHLTRAQPGGMPGWPLITGIERQSNRVVLTWEGPAGAYQLLQKMAVTDPEWQRVGGGSLLRAATITADSSAALFRIAGPPPQYAGSQACQECHNPVVKNVTHTSHSGAFTSPTFIALGGQTDVSCLPCHTVGYGLPTGFSSGARTPWLANVQCESCHGPAAVHAANPEDPVTRPRVEIASAVCGGCHNAEAIPARVAAWHPPRYEEWSGSAHHDVLDELKADFSGPRGSTFIPTCGACHSGTVREALLEGTALPSAHEAGAIGIACATCHDTHTSYAHTNVLTGGQTNLLTGFVITNRELGMLYTNQIASPLASLVDFHSTGSFATNYNPEINLCAQCHNDRGASAKTVERPPHHSSQYNMLLGTFREEDTAVPSNQRASHALLEKQCVACHMAPAKGASGHSFKVQSFELCKSCHEKPELLVQFTTNAVMYQIQQGKAALDLWATTKAPAGLQKYGVKAWEYATAGSLSGAGPSPTAVEQSLIPEAIRKARFNLYLVFNEGSFGIHNGPYAVDLLFSAYELVMGELKK